MSARNPGTVFLDEVHLLFNFPEMLCVLLNAGKRSVPEGSGRFPEGKTEGKHKLEKRVVPEGFRKSSQKGRVAWENYLRSKVNQLKS